MRKKQTGLLVLGAVLLLLCSACRERAVVYDSSAEITDTSGIVDFQGEAVEQAAEAKNAENASLVCVFVCGEVVEPGVYELPLDARLADAIQAAGGMTDTAAKEYLNLAEIVTDGQKIEVPSEEEAKVLEEEAKVLEEAARQEAGGLVNLNLATAEQLMTLTGIGEAKARDILDYREKHGGFSSVEELMQIPGIKSGVFQKIKDQITV